MKEKNYDQAIQSCEQVLQLDPDSLPALLELSKFYELKDDFEANDSVYRRIIQLEPLDASKRVALARILIKQGNIQEAIATYQKALAFPEPPLEAYRELIRALERAKQFDISTSIYQNYLSKGSGLSLLWDWQIVALGKFFLRKVLSKLNRIRLKAQIKSSPDSYEIYAKIWRSLNQVDLDPPAQFSKYPKTIDQYEVEKYFQRTSSYRLMNSTCLTAEDMQYIENASISHTYLELNKSGSIDKTGDSQPKSDISSPDGERVISDQTYQFQFTAIKDQYIYAICPWTGEVLRSNCSFAPRVINSQYVFYRFVGKEVFYVATGRQWLGFPKVCIYFPKIDFIFFYDHLYFREEDEITELKIHLVSNWQPVAAYISRGHDRKTTTLINWDHFAHSLWNELSGLERLVKDKDLLTQNNLSFTIVAEPLGSLEDIFPEISSQQTKRIQENQLTKEILQNNLFVTRVGYNFIQEDLVARTYKTAIKQCSQSLIKEVEVARNKHSLLLWISIRLGDRTWVSQTEGIIQIICALQKDFPDLGVVIDGFSLNNGFKSSPWLIKNIHRETEVVNHIRAAVPSTKIYDTIGCMLYQSLVWANAVDCYIAHHGTIQHKIGWFANKPGVVHSNKYVINGEKKYYDNPSLGLPAAGVRENCILPTYIDQKYVTDVVGDVKRGSEERRVDLDNYDFDWRVIYDEVVKLAAFIPRKSI
jgi:tetratricopeptide (TPR) repeat protein